MTIDTIVSSVFDFNEQIIGVAADKPLNPLTEAEAQWTAKAFREETEEFEQAFADQDIVKMADSALDIVYFAIGTCKRMGMTREQTVASFLAIHNANMTKKKGKVAARGDFADDAAKPADFVPPDQAIGRILFGDDAPN
jgi:predicted HAD superfamily Cof-like phosphohydrolase